MSNIVKQFNVISTENTARVINSNRRVETLIRQYQEQEAEKEFTPVDFTESEEGTFSEGIEAPHIEVEDTEEPAQTPDTEAMVSAVMEDANRQAQEIIENARIQAQTIIDQANSQAEIIFEEKKREAYESGLDQQKEELEVQRNSIEKELNEKEAGLKAKYDDYASQLESDITDAIISVFNKVFDIQFDNKKDILMALIKSTMTNIEIGKEFRIRVSDSNYKFILSRLDELKERVGNDVEIEVVNDANLGASDCQLETSFGIFDCGIDMELNNLFKDIKSLSS